jgi:hypothetical protein
LTREVFFDDVRLLDFFPREVAFVLDFLSREVIMFFELEIVLMERLFKSFVSFANWFSVKKECSL